MQVQRLGDGAVEIRAPAKINLFLQVVNKRPDGYHNINSLFQCVSLLDRLRFTLRSSPGITLHITGESKLPRDDRNLVVQAWEEVSSVHGLKGGLEVVLEKHIPVAAGLAGGSTDAAATILACNMLFELNLSWKDMAALGMKIGSDVPFFFSRGQALVRGRGDEVIDKNLPTDYWLVIASPGFGLSTAKAYAELNLGLTMPRNAATLDGCQTVEELVTLLRQTGNDFEENHLLLHPELVRMKEDISRCGASLVRMSGSGPTMFGIFIEQPDDDRVNRLKSDDRRLFVVQPLVFDRNQLTRGGIRGNY
jgi:4-diphosphocytidyl-2-C-methyl-D-erythritol kinase